MACERAKLVNRLTISLMHGFDSSAARTHTPSAALGNVPQAALRAFFFLRHGARPIEVNIAKLPELLSR
jgi:hypothetical protein